MLSSYVKQHQLDARDMAADLGQGERQLSKRRPPPAQRDLEQRPRDARRVTRHIVEVGDQRKAVHPRTGDVRLPAGHFNS